MQLKVRSLNVTWRRELWGYRVIVFLGNVPNCWLNSYDKFGGATRRNFSLSAKNLRGEADNRPPGRVRVKFIQVLETRDNKITRKEC